MDALTSAKLLAGTQGRWLAAQGQYFKTISPTIGTGQLGPTATAFNATTSAFFLLQNTAPANSNVFAFPDLLRLVGSVVDVVSAASSLQYAIVIDQIPRFSSGGTQLVTPGTYANNNGPAQTSRIGATPLGGQATGAKSYGPQSAIFAGALVLLSESANAVRIAHGSFKALAAAGGVVVVEDEFFVSFSNSYDSGAGSSKVGTTPAIYRQNTGVLGVGPQGSMAIHLWEANQTTAPTLKTDFGWWEAPAYPA